MNNSMKNRYILNDSLENGYALKGSMQNGHAQHSDVCSSDLLWEDFSMCIDWGTIRGKQLGNGSRKVLAVHGWLDNAASFDLVAPYIQKGTTIISIDLPGHGLSDHFPPGFVYDCRSYVGTIKKLITKLKWKSFTYLGHSLGAIVGIIYSAVFPEDINSLISIDIIKPWSLKAEKYADMLKKDFLSYFKNESHACKPPLEYEEDELIHKMIVESRSLDKKCAQILLERSTRSTECGTKRILTRDLRVKAFFIGFTPFEVWHEFARSIKCPILIVKAKDGRNFESPEDYLIMRNAFEEGSVLYRYMELEYKHHVHLTHPEIVGPILSDFFKETKPYVDKMEMH